ncbi:MAG: SDR family oxidoreductase [Acidimicrobiales bacterium]|jgi:3-hydroxybutyrate dehydrogenase/3-oxoacyl-[acyl-carrier protein] reductase|nr:SDR family oxidoreductase [Acidimicrobiales bacterium]MDP6298345.1 SDR family oxidoreductase [Acidimicrobiales bacterium]HJM28273.1 SDR family oxidoreductase [Acidimicrobiales bacterium]HJM97745.1 SDR family oxidoreductase [Acidimicrobiales bacterium]
MELEGQVALITGGTRGIGRGIAEAFVAEGANVVINGRSAEKGDRALNEMEAGDQVHFIAGDVTSQEVCEGLVDQTVEHYGKIDIVVPNAGGGTAEGEVPSPLVDLTESNWQFVLNWNLNHPMWLMRRALKYMIAQGSGRIMSVSSMYGKLVLPAQAPYCTTKHALNGLTKAVAQEVGTLGITVNALCPGGVLTDVMQESGPAAAEQLGMEFEEFLTWMQQPSAIKRMNTVEDCALVAVLLASEAGAGITGSLISIDGGQSPY